ncbi:DUF6438 domain-containing protein [Pontibacter korlensis]|uniref:DUF6438 domain-containing protein n=1 Tax=Pontibacter korlensis TaxID=400092 RepID=UPI0039F08345
MSSCTNSTARSNTPQELLLFQKTPCYGTCPAYNATFYSDGTVLYEGLRYVPVQDTLSLRLTKNQLQEVQATLKDLNHTSLENNYLSTFTDIPSSYLTFYKDNKEVKRIKHQQEGPEKLQQVIKQLHELVMQLLNERQE